jgi:hypothetical protein
LPFPIGVLADALREGNLAGQRVAAALYALVPPLMSAAWIPHFPYLREHPKLLKPGTDPEYFHAQRIRPWIGVIFCAVAIAVGLVSPLPALVLFSFMVIHSQQCEPGRMFLSCSQLM